MDGSQIELVHTLHIILMDNFINTINFPYFCRKKM